MESCVINAGAGNKCTFVCTVKTANATETTTSNAGSIVPSCPGGE
jgi:hypothetical protein